MIWASASTGSLAATVTGRRTVTAAPEPGEAGQRGRHRSSRAVTASAAPSLLTEGARQGEAWIFLTEGADALAQLDPRETLVIERLFRDDSVAEASFRGGRLRRQPRLPGYGRDLARISDGHTGDQRQRDLLLRLGVHIDERLF